MKTPSSPSSRGLFRTVALLCNLLVPNIGTQLLLRAHTGGLAPLGLEMVMPGAILIWSVLFHLVLLLVTERQRQGKALLIILASGFGLALLPGFPLLPADAANPLPGALLRQMMPLGMAACWLSGALLAMAAHATRHLVQSLMPGAGPIRTVPIKLGFSGAIYALGFWLTLSALPMLEGATFAAAPILFALMAASYTAASAGLLVPGHAMMRDWAARGLPGAPLMLLQTLAALAAVALAAAAPEISLWGMSEAGLLLAAAVMGTAFLGRPVIFAGLGLMLCGGALAFVAAAWHADVSMQAIALALLLAIIAASARRRQQVADPISGLFQPPPDVLARFNAVTGGALLTVNVQDQSVAFPDDGGRALGLGNPRSFAELFRESDFSGVLDLMQRLQGPDAVGGAPMRIRLQTRPKAAAGQSSPLPPRQEPFEVHILRHEPPVAWLALVSLQRQQDLEARLLRNETLLGEAVLREERLLSIAAHELRTPIAILSMLGEELKSGLEWRDIGDSFDVTLQRIISILDDLRAGSGTEGGQSASSSFTIRGLSLQVVELFQPAASANGIEIRDALGENCDMAIRCDYSRVFIALSKLIHNAVIHSKGSDVTLTAFLLKGNGNELTVTWQVADNGIGIASADRARIFEPFQTAGGTNTDRPGLGLYTARKAVRLMGGELVQQDCETGACFVLTHPARPEKTKTTEDQDKLDMSDVNPIYTKRSVLLIEDNQLVGEITSARLRRLFQRVDWSETGDGGLAQFRSHAYDLLVVDQLLPGLIGSEIVREIRQTNKTIPIVGITASTMGTECRDLEDAGASYALEKPLSFAQLKMLAEEFFPHDATSPDGETVDEPAPKG